MAQPWKSPHNNTSDTKAVMDGILGKQTKNNKVYAKKIKNSR